MRQAHYYMGLYSYTYSAGLVISTAGYLHLKNSETGAEDWLNLLKSGGSKIFKNVVEGRDVKFELTVELVLIVIYVILYQIVFN
ncbi:oligoendopeptidase F [Streptococcus pneumoniae]|nr:oligoendopeptidase F [Streptococcus pneumoniae]